MRFVRILVSLLVFIVAAIVSTPVSGTAAPTAPYTALSIDGWQSAHVFLPGNGDTISFNYYYGSQIDVQALTADHSMSGRLIIDEPTSGPLTVGTYQTNTYADATHPGLSVYGANCTGPGSLTVLEIVRSGGTITALAASYTFPAAAGSCPGGAHGDVRYQSSVGFAAAQVSTKELDTGSQPINDPPTAVALVLTSAGSQSLQITTVALSGWDASHYDIVSDGCGNTTLAPDATCTITVAPDTSAQGEYVTNLVIADSAGGRTIDVRGKVIWPANATTTPSFLDFGNVELNTDSAPITTTITSTGPYPLALGTLTQVANQGDASGAVFTVLSDDCSGKTLAVGATCTFTTKARPSAPGQTRMLFSIPANLFGGSWGVNVSVFGYERPGYYYQLTPARVLDTRTGLGAPAAIPIGPGGTVSLQVTGQGGVPAKDIAAVVLNVTVTQPTANAYLTVYPFGGVRPYTSSLNFLKGWTGANSVTVKLGTGGKVSFTNSAGTTHVIADVMGYYAGASATVNDVGVGDRYHPLTPSRVFDSRHDAAGRVAGHGTVMLGLDFGALNSHVSAVAVNVTATAPLHPGYLVGWDGSGTKPPTSILNFTAGRTVPNFAIIPVAPCAFQVGCDGLRQFAIYNGSSDTVHVIVDVVGFYADDTVADGLRFSGKTPYRIWDSRKNANVGAPKPLGQGESILLGANPPVVSYPDNTMSGLALNVTAVAPTANTYLTVWPGGDTRPTASNLNPAAGQTVSGAVATSLSGSSHGYYIYNAYGQTHIVVDVVGWFVAWDTVAPPISEWGPVPPALTPPTLAATART